MPPHNDPVSRGVFGRTVKKSQPEGVNRGLRLDNKVQQPHSPLIRWQISESDLRAWRDDIFQFLRSEGLGRC